MIYLRNAKRIKNMYNIFHLRYIFFLIDFNAFEIAKITSSIPGRNTIEKQS